MKLLKVIWEHTKGARASYLLLAVMMTFSLFVTVMLFGYLNCMRSCYDILRNNRMGEAYYITSQDFIDQLMHSGGELDYSEIRETLEALKEDSAVRRVLTVQTVDPVSYNGTRVSILLYNDDLLQAFPALKKLGIDFSRNPDGCILGSKLFQHVRTGQTLSLRFYYPEPHTESFPVAGHMRAPYQYLDFRVSGTAITGTDLFSSGGMILMRESEALLTRLKEVAKVNPKYTFIIEFDGKATPERKAEILEELEMKGPCPSLDSILERSEKSLRENLKAKLPLPIFLLVISTFSYFSTVILTFRKKEKERAVLYLCGCDKKRLARVTFWTLNGAAVLPVLLNLLFVWISPELDWRGILNLEDYLIDGSAVWLIVGYYLVTAGIAVLTVRSGMARHTPLTYLREVRA